MPEIDAQQRKLHLEFLHEGIFQTSSKWPHFAQSLLDISTLAQQCKENDEIVCLERAYVYGGGSLFAPLFAKGNITVVDCQTLSAEERGSYQRDWTNDERYIYHQADIQAPIQNTTLPDNCADVLLIPNVVHHVKDQRAMFAEFARLLKPGGRGYIFEALLRELHQIPDDYVRYTPWGFEHMLAEQELRMTQWTPSGGPFEAISYCWIQALQYLPESLRQEKEAWFYNEHLPELMELDKKYPENQFRAHTSFPVGYGIFFTLDDQ